MATFAGRYIVEDYAGNKYFTMKSFATLPEALEELTRFSYKARIKHNGKVIKYNHNWHSSNAS